MSDGSLYLSTPPFGPAITGRGLRVVRQVIEKTNSTGWAGKDISSRWTYQLRCWDPGASSPSFIIDEAISASSTDDTTGWLDDYVSCGATAYESSLEWELVEIDTSNADANTASGDREVVLLRWRQPILDNPTS